MLIAEEIAKNSTGEIPGVLLESELDKMFLELKNSIGEMGMELDKYLEHIKKTEEDLRKEWGKDAEKRVKIALSLRAIAEKEHIEPSEEEVETKANNSLNNFKNDGHDIKKIDRAALAEYSKNIIRNQKVFEFLERMMNS
jgi:trigger factor